MKTIFYIISIVVIGAAAFFAFSNSGKIEEQIDQYAEANGLKRNVESTIAQKEKDLGDTNAALLTSRENNAIHKQTLENEQAKERAARTSLGDYQVQIKEHDADLAELAELEAEIKQKIGDMEWNQIGPEIRKLQEERKEKGRRMAELEILVENLTKEIADKRAEHGRQTSTLAEVQRKIALNARVGAITFVDTTWGFVVVNLGSSNSNITLQSKLLVTRAGRLLGTLTPNSVGPTQTVCDLNARDLAPGVRIQSGDKVTLDDTVGGR